MRETSLWLKAFAGLACASGLTLAVGWWGNSVDESNPVRIATLHAAPTPKEEPERMVVWSVSSPNGEIQMGKAVWSPDGKSILTEGRTKEKGEGAINEWDAKTCKLLRSYRGSGYYYGSLGFTNSLAISPDNKWVAVAGRKDDRNKNGSDECFVEVWQRDNEKPTFKFTDFDIFIAVSFSIDGKTLFTRDPRGAIRAWDMGNGKLLYQETYKNLSDRTDLIFHPTRADVGTLVGSHWFNPVTGKPLKFDPYDIEFDFDSTCSAFNSTGSCIAIAGIDSPYNGLLPLIVLDVNISKGNVVSTSKPRKSTDTFRRNCCIHHLAFSPDNKLIAAACGDGTVRLVDPSTAKQLAVAKEHLEKVTSVAFSPDGKYLFSVSHDCMTMWNVAEFLKEKSTPLK